MMKDGEAVIEYLTREFPETLKQIRTETVAAARKEMARELVTQMDALIFMTTPLEGAEILHKTKAEGRICAYELVKAYIRKAGGL
jgi:hypothetical protein